MKIECYLFFGLFGLLFFLPSCKEDCEWASNDYVFDYCEGKAGENRPRPEIESTFDCTDGGPAYFVSGCFTNQNCSQRTDVFEQLGFVYAKDNPSPTINDRVLGLTIKDILGVETLCDSPIPFIQPNNFKSFDIESETKEDLNGKPREIKVTSAFLPDLAEGTYYISPYVVDFFGCSEGENTNAAEGANNPEFRVNYFDYRHVRKFTVDRLSNLGQYLSLEGIGFAEISAPPSELQNEAGPFTISFWMRTSDQIGFFFEHSDLEVFVSGSHIGVRVNNDFLLSSIFDGNQVEYADGLWHRFSIVRSITTEANPIAELKVMMDGRVLQKVSPVGLDTFEDAPIVLGARFNEGSNSENTVSLAPIVDIDEIAIWNEDRSAILSNSTQLFCPIEINDPNLVSYWSLNGSGTSNKGTETIGFENTQDYSFKTH